MSTRPCRERSKITRAVRKRGRAGLKVTARLGERRRQPRVSQRNWEESGAAKDRIHRRKHSDGRSSPDGGRITRVRHRRRSHSPLPRLTRRTHSLIPPPPPPRPGYRPNSRRRLPMREERPDGIWEEARVRRHQGSTTFVVNLRAGQTSHSSARERSPSRLGYGGSRLPSNMSKKAAEYKEVERKEAERKEAASKEAEPSSRPMSSLSFIRMCEVLRKYLWKKSKELEESPYSWHGWKFPKKLLKYVFKYRMAQLLGGDPSEAMKILIRTHCLKINWAFEENRELCEVSPTKSQMIEFFRSCARDFGHPDDGAQKYSNLTSSSATRSVNITSANDTKTTSSEPSRSSRNPAPDIIGDAGNILSVDLCKPDNPNLSTAFLGPLTTSSQPKPTKPKSPSPPNPNPTKTLTTAQRDNPLAVRRRIAVETAITGAAIENKAVQVFHRRPFEISEYLQEGAVPQANMLIGATDANITTSTMATAKTTVTSGPAPNNVKGSVFCCRRTRRKKATKRARNTEFEGASGHPPRTLPMTESCSTLTPEARCVPKTDISTSSKDALRPLLNQNLDAEIHESKLRSHQNVQGAQSLARVVVENELAPESCQVLNSLDTSPSVALPTSSAVEITKIEENSSKTFKKNHRKNKKNLGLRNARAEILKRILLEKRLQRMKKQGMDFGTGGKAAGMEYNISQGSAAVAAPNPTRGMQAAGTQASKKPPKVFKILKKPMSKRSRRSGKTAIGVQDSANAYPSHVTNRLLEIEGPSLPINERSELGVREQTHKKTRLDRNPWTTLIATTKSPDLDSSSARGPASTFIPEDPAAVPSPLRDLQTASDTTPLNVTLERGNSQHSIQSSTENEQSDSDSDEIEVVLHDEDPQGNPQTTIDSPGEYLEEKSPPFDIPHMDAEASAAVTTAGAACYHWPRCRGRCRFSRGGRGGRGGRGRGSRGTQRECHWGIRCTRVDCWFKHPPGRSLE